MPEKHVKSKETDITGALVILLILMVAVAIVKFTGDFTAQKTSTSTKAKLRADASIYTKYCIGKVASNLGQKYNTSGVTSTVFAKTYSSDCGSLNMRYAMGVLLSGGPTDPAEPGICCAALSALYAVSNDYCTSQTPMGHWPDGKTVEHIPAVCKDKSDCTGTYGTVDTREYTVSTSYKCDNFTTTSIKKNKNYCCMMPLPTGKP